VNLHKLLNNVKQQRKHYKFLIKQKELLEDKFLVDKIIDKLIEVPLVALFFKVKCDLIVVL
jgi:hypothetical protein